MTIVIDTKTYQSPNHNSRNGQPVIGLVLHTTEGHWDSDARWLSSAASQVSSHYVISPQARIYRLVDEKLRAWHAGVGEYLGYSDWNSVAIGIEVSHIEGSPWAPLQREALANLCRVLIGRYGIKQSMVVAHRWIAPDRRHDPTDFNDRDLVRWIAGLYATTAPPDWPALWGTATPYNPTWGIPSKWRMEHEAGRPLGKALSPEVYNQSDIVVQCFEKGWIFYRRSTGHMDVLR